MNKLWTNNKRLIGFILLMVTLFWYGHTEAGHFTDKIECDVGLDMPETVEIPTNGGVK